MKVVVEVPEVICATVEHGVGATTVSPVVPWWSFTNTILAATALTLVRDHALPLDQPIDGEPYTLRQLPQQTPGLGDYGDLADYHAPVERRDAPRSVAELLHRSRANELRYQPVRLWQYSNLGDLKVRQLIERTAEMPLDLVFRRAVFEPLGIKGAQLAGEPADPRGFIAGEADGYHPAWVYHGLRVGPLHEAAQFLDRLRGGALLPVEPVQEMRSARRIGSAVPGRPWREPGYGLGLMSEMGESDGPVGHTGGGPGSTIAVYNRERLGAPIVVAAFASGNDQGIVERTAFGLPRAQGFVPRSASALSL